MEKTTKSHGLSESPPEDYNPLADEGEFMSVQVEEDSLEDDVLIDAESAEGETEHDETAYDFKYAVTPPNHRANRRLKDKMNSQRYNKNLYKGRKSSEKVWLPQKYSQALAIKRTTASISDELVTPISVSYNEKEDYPSPGSECVKRRNSAKNYNRGRTFDRDMKHNSSHMLAEYPPVEPVFVKPINVDTHNRFLSLNSKQVSPSHAPDQSGMLSPKRQLSFIAKPECSKEREQFYKTFSVLIKMGNSTTSKKERESRYSRQMSSEQEVWQNKLNDLIWLNLQAWHNKRTVRDQDEYLYNARQNIDNVLKKVMYFKFKYVEYESDYGKDITKGQNEGPGPPHGNGQKDMLFVANEKIAFNETNLFTETEKQHQALLQVNEILEELEMTENLYPTLKVMRKAHPLYASEEFEIRTSSLCMWLNITKDLIWKLQLLANILQIDRREDVLWPYQDFHTSFSKLIAIRNAENVIVPEESCSDDELMDGCFEEDDADMQSSENTENSQTKSIGKNVRFSLEPRNSTPSPSNSPSEFLPQSSIPVCKSESNCGMLSSFSASSLDEQEGGSLYRCFADRMLKKTGMRKMQQRLQVLLAGTLDRAKRALCRANSFHLDAEGTKSKNNGETTIRASSSSGVAVSPVDRRLSLIQMNPEDCSLDIKAMNLPSLMPAYLFLARVPLDVVHECIRIRLEQMGETEPSLLSIRQLIRECKEVLNGSVVIMQFYKDYVCPVFSQESETKYETHLEAFVKDMKLLLGVYLKYIISWMRALQVVPEASLRLKEALEDEWNFTQNVCPHVQGGEAQAGNTFCRMASGLFESITHFLDSEIDDCVRQLYDSTLGDSMVDEEPSHRSSWCEVRQGVLQCCRHFKLIFHEARERTSKAVGFAKMLRKDLEIAAAYHVRVGGVELMEKLNETNHVMVNAPHNAGYLTFVPSRIASDRDQILKLLDVSCGREDNRNQAFTSMSHEGYLLLVHCEELANMNELCPLWKGETILVEPNAETTIALSHIAVEGLLLVVHQSSQLNSERKEFEHLMLSILQLTSEQTSCHQAIAESLSEMKFAAMELRDHVALAISQVDDKLNLNEIPDMEHGERHNIRKLYRETLQQCYNFGFEYHKDLTRIVSGELRNKVAFDLVEFAQQWMKFVSEKCERGRGRRPRWASQGLDFLIVACDPKILALLTNEEFEHLKSSMNNCIIHVVGDRINSSSPGAGYSHASSPEIHREMLRYPSWPDTPSTARHSRSFTSEPPTPFALNEFETKEPVSPRERFTTATKRIEQRRTNLLFQKGMIGRITSHKQELDSHLSIRRVNFKWQRGNKIGEGQFGKVYTAVNMDTGELMAMKEIRFQPNDLQTIKDIGDEIKIFEGITHNSLVRYFGVEFHREEMLIFMEYCDEGTIEDIARLGLGETQIRRYTQEILVAVHVLHEHSIVHRDIKGANIFLRSDGPLKLGDFGCAVKLKSHNTTPGEVNTLVGTTAFMAPEVITRNTEEGSGRAADIWSLGCVVIEMTTGKRPWSELENNMQIMFKVGMGATPSAPDSLSSEGTEFLSHCFQMNPKERWTSAQLLDHPFVKVYKEHDEDEN